MYTDEERAFRAADIDRKKSPYKLGVTSLRKCQKSFYKA